MVKRFSMVFLTMILAVIALLLAAKNPTGDESSDFDVFKTLYSGTITATTSGAFTSTVTTKKSEIGLCTQGVSPGNKVDFLF